MAELVVDVFEVVEVDEHQADRSSTGAGGFDRGIESLDETAAVDETGQRVLMGLHSEMAMGRRDHVGHRVEPFGKLADLVIVDVELDSMVEVAGTEAVG